MQNRDAQENLNINFNVFYAFYLNFGTSIVDPL